MTNPLIWLALVGWLLAGGVYGFQKLQQGRQWQVAYDEGLEAGKGATASTALAAAVETAKEERKAIEDTPLPPDKAAVIALCKRSASCRERGTLK
jgi:hypothetical protein